MCFAFFTGDQRKPRSADWFGSSGKNGKGEESDGLNGDSVLSDSGDGSSKSVDDCLTPSEMNDQSSVRRGSFQQPIPSGKTNDPEETALPCPQRPEALGKEGKGSSLFET